jgi:hypothetical protein
MLTTMYEAAPSETAFSLAVAESEATFSPDLRRMVAIAFQANNPLLHTAPCRLQRFCEITHQAYGAPHDVLTERTLYPLYMSCLCAPLAEKLAYQACFSKHHRMFCRIVPLPIKGANRYGLECKDCSSVSMHENGRRCSFTFHCIPLSTRCPIHGTSLTLADPCSAHEIKLRASDTNSRRRNSLKLCKILYRMSQSVESLSAVNEVRVLMRSRGYIPENGPLRAQQFISDVFAFCSGGFEDERINVCIRSADMLAAALRGVLYHNYPAHPVAIALLRMALDVIACQGSPVRKKTPLQQGPTTSTSNEGGDLSQDDLTEMAVSGTAHGQQAATSLRPIS